MSLKSAIRIGVSINDFNEMTPYELSLAIQVFNDRIKIEQENELVLTYLGAYWQRVKNMPSLSKVLGKEQPKKKMTAEEMLAVVKQMNAAFGGTTEGVK